MNEVGPPSNHPQIPALACQPFRKKKKMTTEARMRGSVGRVPVEGVGGGWGEKARDYMGLFRGEHIDFPDKKGPLLF